LHFCGQSLLSQSEKSESLDEDPFLHIIGLEHFSMVVPNKEEFQRLADQLSKSGTALNALSEMSGIIHDNDGIKIQMRHD